MGQQLEIDKENQTVLLFSTKKQEWEDKTMSLSDINIASYHGKVSGYEIQFNGADKKFFYKEENVHILHKVKNININKHDVFANGITDIQRKKLFLPETLN